MVRQFPAPRSAAPANAYRIEGPSAHVSARIHFARPDQRRAGNHRRGSGLATSVWRLSAKTRTLRMSLPRRPYSDSVERGNQSSAGASPGGEASGSGCEISTNPAQSASGPTTLPRGMKAVDLLGYGSPARRRARKSNPQPAKPASDFEIRGQFFTSRRGTGVTHDRDVPWCHQRRRENRTRRTRRKPFAPRGFRLIYS